jgi:hypothetical protein
LSIRINFHRNQLFFDDGGHAESAVNQHHNAN